MNPGRCTKCFGDVRVAAKVDCPKGSCPVLMKYYSQFRVKQGIQKEDFFGSSPTPFVGRFGYPNINVGLLSTNDFKSNAYEYDSPITWSHKNYQIPKIVDYRSELINSRFKSDVKVMDGRYMDTAKEVAMSKLPVDIELSLKKKPSFGNHFNGEAMPFGPNAPLKKAMLTENPKIPTKVDKIFSENDLKATEGMNFLFKKGFDENYISEMLSVGVFGVKTDRKLVPTRWSITATDDTIGKNLIKQIKDYSNKHGYCAYFGGYLGNYFLILCLPDAWSYELFEMYTGNSKAPYSTDNEWYNGRKEYAHNTAGGYYASRLAILEKLNQIKRQSSIIELRFITDEYSMPLGVWVVREAARRALKNKPIEFNSKEEMLGYAKRIAQSRFNYDVSTIYARSKLLKESREQRKLLDY